MTANEHYPTTAERLADWWVHAVALVAAGFGGIALLSMSAIYGGAAQVAALAIYAACLVAMFGCSAAYNLTRGDCRPLLRRFDHAGIFLMIAGTYTPFTTLVLKGGWSVVMTATIWGGALAGVLGKLLLPGVGKGLWVALYLGLGWLAVVVIYPLSMSVSALSLGLLIGGGVLYSVGVPFYAAKRLRFRRAIWHGFVVAAAALHYVSVLLGIVLFPKG